MKQLPLYKYLPLKYAEDLVIKGIIKLGTLYEYQDTNLHGNEIGDQEEGNLEEWVFFNKSNVTNKDLTEFERRQIYISDDTIGNSFINCRIICRNKTIDSYIFSTSRFFNVELMRKLSRNLTEKYDACVKIHDPQKFIQTISESDEFKKYGNYIGIGLCHYRDRSIHHSKIDSMPHPILIKEPKYEYQGEVRVVWESKSTERINSKILKIPELTNYCELFYVDKQSTQNDLPIITKLNFKNDVVKMDLPFYHKCNFSNSQIIYIAKDMINLDKLKFFKCEFHSCKFGLVGEPEEIIDYKKFMSHNFGYNFSHGNKFIRLSEHKG